MCTGALTQWEVAPHAKELRKFEWNHESFDCSRYQDRKVKSGTYTIIQFLRDANSPFRATEITITEQGEQALQSRVVYNRFEDPSAFIYELNNRASEPFSFDFSTDRKVGFQIREYDVRSHTAGELLYTDTSGTPMIAGLTIDPFDEYSWTETWNRIDKDGNPLAREFYWLEMWLLDQDPDYRAGRMVLIDE